MADYGVSDVSTTPLGANQYPVSEVYVPSVGLKALGGGHVQNDGSKDYAPVLMSPLVSTTGTPTSIAGSVSAVQLLASNVARKGAYVYNDSAATLYIGLFAHTSLTTSLYTTQVAPNQLYEMPTSPLYTGEISGIWASATGNARCTEMT